MRTEFLPFAMPFIEESDVAEVAEVVRSGWLTSGPRLAKFELEVAAALATPAALALASGTAGMHLALTVLGLPPGSAVITTPMTFCATAHVIEHVGCRPLFVDVEPDTLNLDPEQVAAVLADGRTQVSAILPVHYGGHPVELDRLLELGRRDDLAVVEDAAHAFGAAYRGRPIGQVDPDDCRRAVAFSLYATKNITSGEGGVLTGGHQMIERARLWSLHGMSRDSWQRYGPRGSWDYEVVAPGFKENMSDIHAALALTQLRRWQALQQRRSELAGRYHAALGDVEEIELPRPRDHVTPAWHLFPIRLRLEQLRIDRAEFIEQLRERKIGTSVHFIPLHLQPYYRDRYQLARDDLPVAAHAFDRLVSLPLYPRMSNADLDDVTAAIRAVVARARRVR